MSSRALVIVSLLALVACNKKSDPKDTPTSSTSTATTADTPTATTTASAASTGAVTSTASYPNSEAGAKQLLGEFLKPSTDRAALSKGLRPTSADYKAIYDADTAKKLEDMYAKDWDSGRLVVTPKTGQTEVKLWAASSEDLKANKGNAKEFPGGYKKVAPHLNAGQTIYRFKFVKPGDDLGMAFDGLSYANGHWFLIPKPYRAVRGGDD